MPTYLIKVETTDGDRWIGPELGLVRSKIAAREFYTIERAMDTINRLNRVFPDKSFGLDVSDTSLEVFQKENGY